MTASTFRALRTECNSSVFSSYPLYVRTVLNIHSSHTSTSLHHKNVSKQYQKKANNRRKHCNPAAIFLVVVERWTALATNTAERLSLIRVESDSETGGVMFVP